MSPALQVDSLPLSHRGSPNQLSFNLERKSTLSERSQSPKVTHIIRFHLYELSRMDTSVVTESRLVVAGAGRRGGWGVSSNGRGVSFGDDENILE